MRGSRFVRMSIAAAIVVAGVGLGPDKAGADPQGSTDPTVTVAEDDGSVIQYTCTGTDLLPLTVSVSVDECYLKDAAGNVLDRAPAPVVVPGHVAATGSVTITGLGEGDTFYVCYTVTSSYELAPRRTVSDCDEKVV